MPTMEPLTSATPWHRLAADEADWQGEDPRVLACLLEQLLVIRRFEERILELFKAGCVHGPAHASIGQEGGAVGAMSTGIAPATSARTSSAVAVSATRMRSGRRGEPTSGCVKALRSVRATAPSASSGMTID